MASSRGGEAGAPPKDVYTSMLEVSCRQVKRISLYDAMYWQNPQLTALTTAAIA
jgi:hypothetical protein